MDSRWYCLRDVAGQPVRRSPRPHHCGALGWRNARFESALVYDFSGPCASPLGMRKPTRSLGEDVGGVFSVVAQLAETSLRYPCGDHAMLWTLAKRPPPQGFPDDLTHPFLTALGLDERYRPSTASRTVFKSWSLPHSLGR